MDIGIGLVLAGGGGKGSYHIGVWRALKEYGFDKNITAVSGTSIGALNAALFAQADYNAAENIWLNLKQDMIFQVDISKIMIDFLKTGIGIIPNAALTFFTGLDGVFSRDALLKIINEKLDLYYIANNKMSCYATCCKVPILKAKYFDLNKLSIVNMKKALLATSALPFIYDTVKINGDFYYDGGILDNIPISPLYEDGYRKFIVSHLDKGSMIDTKKFPEADFIQIIPSVNQGSLLNGTLDFSHDGVVRRINQGYNDAVKVLKNMYKGVRPFLK